MGRLSIGCDVTVRADDAPLVRRRLGELLQMAENLDWFMPLRLPHHLTWKDLNGLETDWDGLPHNNLHGLPVSSSSNNPCRDTPRVIRPPAKPLRLAHAFSGVIRGMAARLPACLRDHALPSDRLPLHLLCLTTMLQQGKFPPTDTELLHHECGLSLFMSLEIAARHLHWLRVAYPADERGLFMAADRAIFFHLDQTPRPLAEIQSVFRDVRQKEVVRSLQRAVAAGLAWEPRPGCFAVSPPPPPPSRAEIMSSIVAAGTDGY
jgi:hypothetical protein